MSGLTLSFTAKWYGLGYYFANARTECSFNQIAGKRGLAGEFRRSRCQWGPGRGNFSGEISAYSVFFKIFWQFTDRIGHRKDLHG